MLGIPVYLITILHVEVIVKVKAVDLLFQNLGYIFLNKFSLKFFQYDRI